MKVPDKSHKGIFISYRRADSAGEAGRLSDHLVAAFGAEAIFFDVIGIMVGDDWRQRLESALDTCDTMLVVLGRQWLTLPSIAYPAIRRIEERDDMVAWEVIRGLTRGLRVVQVLVQDSTALVPESLPPPLAGLAMRQSVRLRHESFAADVRDLVMRIRRSRRVRSVFHAQWQESDLKPWARVLDSGNDCTGAAITVVNALELLLARAGTPRALSVRHLYEKARRHQSSSDHIGGVYMLPVLFVAGFFGVLPEAVWPYRAGESALPEERDWQALDTYPGFHCRGDFFHCDSLLDAVRQLAAGRPVMAGCDILNDTWFESPCIETGEVPMPPVNHVKIMGIATVLLIGFDPVGQCFHFMGTWGTKFGRAGFGTMRLDVARRVISPGNLWSVELAAITVAQLLEQRVTAKRTTEVKQRRRPKAT